MVTGCSLVLQIAIKNLVESLFLVTVTKFSSCDLCVMALVYWCVYIFIFSYRCIYRQALLIYIWQIDSNVIKFSYISAHEDITKFIIHNFGWDVLLSKGLLASNFTLPCTGKLTALPVIVFGILLSNASMRSCKYSLLQEAFDSTFWALCKNIVIFFHLILGQTSSLWNDTKPLWVGFRCQY